MFRQERVSRKRDNMVPDWLRANGIKPEGKKWAAPADGVTVDQLKKQIKELQDNQKSQKDKEKEKRGKEREKNGDKRGKSQPAGKREAAPVEAAPGEKPKRSGSLGGNGRSGTEKPTYDIKKVDTEKCKGACWFHVSSKLSLSAKCRHGDICHRPHNLQLNKDEKAWIYENCKPGQRKDQAAPADGPVGSITPRGRTRGRRGRSGSPKDKSNSKSSKSKSDGSKDSKRSSNGSRDSKKSRSSDGSNKSGNSNRSRKSGSRSPGGRWRPTAAPCDTITEDYKKKNDWKPRWSGLPACFEYMNKGSCDGKVCDNGKKYIHVTKEVYEREKKKMDAEKKRR